MLLEELINNLEFSPDRREKREEFFGILIHHTGIPEKKDNLNWVDLYGNVTKFLAKKDDVYVSTHFIISLDGHCTELVDYNKYEAFHAGKSSWWNPVKREWCEDLNRYFIGIELLGDGNQDTFTDAQYSKLTKICACLMEENQRITPHTIIGHEMVSPGRKVDPGKYFNWNKFFDLLYKERLCKP